MASIAAVIEVVERAVVRRRRLWARRVAGPSKARAASPAMLWPDIDLDAIQWEDDTAWHTRPAVAYRVGAPPDAEPATRSRA